MKFNPNISPVDVIRKDSKKIRRVLLHWCYEMS